MTCRASRRMYSSLTEIRIPAGSTEPANHVPILSRYVEGLGAPCDRCGQIVTSDQWARETCPGKPAPWPL